MVEVVVYTTLVLIGIAVIAVFFAIYWWQVRGEVTQIAYPCR
jgi:mannose/fructose/N-acetylgalactosamine-specific phosphotransferase system component IIC